MEKTIGKNLRKLWKKPVEKPVEKTIGKNLRKTMEKTRGKTCGNYVFKKISIQKTSYECYWYMGFGRVFLCKKPFSVEN